MRAIIPRRRRVKGRHRLPILVQQLNRVRSLVTESLVRNSAFLALNLGIGAVCGFGALSLITHLYPVHAVGLSAAALSATGLISAISQLGFNYSLPRFLSRSGIRTVMLNTVLTMTMLIALISAGIFLALPTAAKLYALGGSAFAAMFVLGTTLSAGVNQLENILVADRAAHKIASANVTTSLVKLAAPVAFLSLGISGAYLAQNIGFAVGFIVLTVVLAKRGQRFRPKLSIAATRRIRRYSAGSYIAGLIGGLPMQILPLIILARFGPSQNAYWYTAMAVATLLYQLPGSVGQALLAEAAHDPSARRPLMRRATLMICAVMLPVLTATYLAAPLGLKLLGHGYANGSLDPLRWLVVAGVMSSVNYLAGTVLYLAKRTLVITVINAVNAVIVLGLAAAWATDAKEIAMSWVIGEVANVALFTLFAIHSLRQVHGRWEELGGG